MRLMRSPTPAGYLLGHENSYGLPVGVVWWKVQTARRVPTRWLSTSTEAALAPAGHPSEPLEPRGT